MQSKSSYTESCNQWRDRNCFLSSVFSRWAELSRSPNLENWNRWLELRGTTAHSSPTNTVFCLGQDTSPSSPNTSGSMKVEKDSESHCLRLNKMEIRKIPAYNVKKGTWLGEIFHINTTITKQKSKNATWSDWYRTPTNHPEVCTWAKERRVQELLIPSIVRRKTFSEYTLPLTDSTEKLPENMNLLTQWNNYEMRSGMG